MLFFFFTFLLVNNYIYGMSPEITKQQANWRRFGRECVDAELSFWRMPETADNTGIRLASWTNKIWIIDKDEISIVRLDGENEKRWQEEEVQALLQTNSIN